MSTKFYLVIAVIAFSVKVEAQSNSAVPDNVRAANAIDAFVSSAESPGYLLYGIPDSAGGVIGSVYLVDDWKMTTLKIINYDKLFSNYPCKVNLYSNLIEIKIDNVVKAVDGIKVESFYWNNENTYDQSVYRNANVYQIRGIPQTGFLEVLVEGKIPLYKRTQVTIKKPDYNAALNIGSKNTKIVKEETIYFAKKNELIRVKSIKGRNFTSLFGESSTTVDKFMKDKSLKISIEADLVLIFKYYNQMEKKEGA